MLIPTLLASAALVSVGGLTIYTVRKTGALVRAIDAKHHDVVGHIGSVERIMRDEIALEGDIRRSLSHSVAERFEKWRTAQGDVEARVAGFEETFEDAKQEIIERRAQVDADKGQIAAHNQKILDTTAALRKAVATMSGKTEEPAQRQLLYKGEHTNDAGVAVPVEAHHLSHSDVMRSLEAAFGAANARAFLEHCFKANIAFHHMAPVAPQEPAIRGSKPLADE